jgi:aromatic-amino-acid transaminase
MFPKDIPFLPEDAIFALSRLFEEDQRDNKIDLGIGIYHDDKGKAAPFQAVLEAKKMWSSQKQSASYLPIVGDLEFTDLVGELVFEKKRYLSNKDHIAAVQGLGGTGSLYLAASFLQKFSYSHVYIPDPTWGNHSNIFAKENFHLKRYSYYDSERHTVAVDTILSEIEKTANGSVFLFHASCHNPTGCDPTLKQWEDIAEAIKRKKILPIFDMAYQGFGEGLDEDARSVRLFLDKGIDFLLSYSCSKSFGLYRERTGALFAFTKDKSLKEPIFSQLRAIIRKTYSNPPSYGAYIVRTTLSNPKLYKMWSDELSSRKNRIQKIRTLLIEKIKKRAPSAFSFMSSHKGMFSYTEIPKEKIIMLREKAAIYLVQNGRMNLSNIPEDQIDHIAGLLVEYGL